MGCKWSLVQTHSEPGRVPQLLGTPGNWCGRSRPSGGRRVCRAGSMKLKGKEREVEVFGVREGEATPLPPSPIRV